jgi:hypothetical protein
MLALAGSVSGQEYSDPVGYTSHTLPGNSECLLPLQLAQPVSFKEFVTEVTASGIRFAKQIPWGAFGEAGKGYMEVRVGNMAGLAIPATAFSGNFLTLERSPVGLVSVGDFASIRAEQSLGQVFGDPEYLALQTGTTALEADNVSIWDVRTQTSRVFYFHTGQGWREAGKEAEGDKALAPVLFPSGVIVRRRAATPVIVVVTGSVIIPLENRYHPVWPGRNIISAPFTHAPTVSYYIRPLQDAPFTVTSAASAPKADTLRFTRFEGTISPVIYFRTNQWRVVGADQDAENTNIDFNPCLDLQRFGGAGYIRFWGFDTSQSTQTRAVAASVAPVTEVKPVTLNLSATGLRVNWPAKPGVIYQVQTQPIGASTWTNLQEPVQSATAIASITFRPVGNGIIRVIQP